MTLLLICLMQMSADSVEESPFFIMASSIVNPVGSGTRQNWRIQMPLYISCVTEKITPRLRATASHLESENNDSCLIWS